MACTPIPNVALFDCCAPEGCAPCGSISGGMSDSKLVQTYNHAAGPPYHPSVRWWRNGSMARPGPTLGFTVMTGGGPGIMQAGNQGAHEIGGRSIGVNIELPFEQDLNPYVHRSITMRYFFTRKVVLVKYSYAFIVMPGGAGTMDEMFETMTLIQTGKLKGFPIILMGKDYWQPLMDFVYRMAEEGTISPDDPELIFFTDDVEDAVAHLQRHAVRQFGLRKKRTPHPIRVLGEKPIVG